MPSTAVNQSISPFAVLPEGEAEPSTKQQVQTTEAEPESSAPSLPSLDERVLLLATVTGNGASSAAASEHRTSIEPHEQGPPYSDQVIGTNQGQQQADNAAPNNGGTRSPSPQIEPLRPAGSRPRPRNRGRRRPRDVRRPTTPSSSRQTSRGANLDVPERRGQGDALGPGRQGPAVAMPCASDFGPHSRSSLNLAQFILGPKPAKMQPDDPSLPAFAPPPSIPRYLVSEVDRERKRRRVDRPPAQRVSQSPSPNRVSQAQPTHHPQPASQFDEGVQPERVSQLEEASRIQQATQSPESSDSAEPPLGSLSRIPREVRRLILSHILVSEEPFQVLEGWTKPRSSNRSYRRPNIDISVVSVCRQFYWESLPVLYGANKFVYLLRDAVAAAPPHVDELTGEEAGAEASSELSMMVNIHDDSPLDDDYIEQAGRSRQNQRRSTRRRARMQTEQRGLINIAKYVPLIRDVIIVAEQNRYGLDTLQSMADAVQVFVEPPAEEVNDIALPIEPTASTASAHARKKRKRNEPSLTKQNESNLRSLTIRVHPTSDGLDADDKETFTFTDFFARQSKVILALKELLIKFIYIEVFPTKLTDDASRRPVRMAMDMTPRRTRAQLNDGKEDFWAGSACMFVNRVRQSRQCLMALHSLQTELVSCCRAFRHDGPTAAELQNWEQFSDFGWWSFDDD